MNIIIFVWLAVSIFIILFTILKLKLNPAISLVLASIFMGIMSSLGGAETINKISQGFGSIMTGIGLSVGFGVILGQLLSDSGGARVIANIMIKITSEKFALYALGITGFILSIPVFYDVTFVILIPLAIAVSKQIKKPLHYTVGVMIIGAGAAHTLVPPTPNPLAAAEILKFDLGIMVMAGIIIGLIASLLAMKIYILIMDRGFWNKEKDETSIKVYEENFSFDTNTQTPSFILSIIPVVLPILLILSGTVASVFTKNVPTIITFLSNKVIALLFGVIGAYIVALKAMNKNECEKSATEALKSCGIVLLITGAGGSFGAVISATGIANIIAEVIKNVSPSPTISILIAFFIAAVFRIVLGSGTVASITTMTIMSSVPTVVGIHSVWLAMACLSGSLSIGHINDSGFWVSTNLSGFTIVGGLKTYTLGNAITAIMVVIMGAIGSLFIKM